MELRKLTQHARKISISHMYVSLLESREYYTYTLHTYRDGPLGVDGHNAVAQLETPRAEPVHTYIIVALILPVAKYSSV